MDKLLSILSQRLDVTIMMIQKNYSLLNFYTKASDP